MFCFLGTGPVSEQDPAVGPSRVGRHLQDHLAGAAEHRVMGGTLRRDGLEPLQVQTLMSFWLKL